MLCPKCGREMDAGFLQSDAKIGITWVSKLLPMGVGYWKNDAKVVSEHLRVGVTAVPAHICKICKLFLGDYSGKD